MSRPKATSVRRKLRVARGRALGASRWRRETVEPSKAKRTTRGAATPAVPAPRDDGSVLRPSRTLEECAYAVASACGTAAAGFDVCARRTSDETIAVAAKSAAIFLRSVLESTVAAAAGRGIDVRPRSRTGDRLRWEWLASTATVMDGCPDRRLLAECARILAEVDAAALHELDRELAARFRLALAEGHSLAFASDHMLGRQLLPAHT